MLILIVSGAQTGADRAALDVAIWYEFPHGGWCPKGRKAELMIGFTVIRPGRDAERF